MRVFESKCRRRIRLRIGDIEDELGRLLSVEEIIQEFKKRGYKRVVKVVVEGILHRREKREQSITSHENSEGGTELRLSQVGHEIHDPGGT